MAEPQKPRKGCVTLQVPTESEPILIMNRAASSLRVQPLLCVLFFLSTGHKRDG
jgi:hypothetical protein